MMRYIEEAKAVAEDFCEKGCVGKGSLVVIGCSTSEISGKTIGSMSDPDLAKNVFAAMYSVFCEKGIHVAVQCCEHLNRALVVERNAVHGQDIVNVIPQPKAGGSFATAAYAVFHDPVVVEHIRADAGLDIGDTLIGMHLKEVAVPVRLSCQKKTLALKLQV